MDQSRQSEQRGGQRSGTAQSNLGAAQSGTDASSTRDDFGTGSRSNAPASHGQDTIVQAQEQAGKLMGIAREQATSQLATQKVRVASSLGTLATALQDASRQMQDGDGAAMAGYVETAAGQLDHLAKILDEQDVEQLLKATEQFARRQPALFLGAAFALGFAAARFLRSSPRLAGETSASESFIGEHRSSTEQSWLAGSAGLGASGSGASAAPGGQ